MLSVTRAFQRTCAPHPVRKRSPRRRRTIVRITISLPASLNPWVRVRYQWSVCCWSRACTRDADSRHSGDHCAIVSPHRERENRESNWLDFTQDVGKVSTYEVNWLVVLWKILRYEELPRGYRGRFEINLFSRINLIPFISRMQSREGWVSRIERRSPRVLHMYIHISWQVVDNENGMNFFVILGKCFYIWGNSKIQWIVVYRWKSMELRIYVNSIESRAELRLDADNSIVVMLMEDWSRMRKPSNVSPWVY